MPVKKELLVERLALIDKAINEHSTQLQQVTANLNMLNGCRQELDNVIKLFDESAAVEDSNVAQDDCVADAS